MVLLGAAMVLLSGCYGVAMVLLGGCLVLRGIAMVLLGGW